MDSEVKGWLWFGALIAAVIIAIVIGITVATIATSGPQTCTIGKVGGSNGQTIYLCD